MTPPIRILCAGAGHMGRSHALAYHRLPGFEICGIVTRSPESRAALNADAHTQTQALRLHHAELDASGNFSKGDETLRLDDEPDHDDLCHREQEYFLKAIREDLDLTNHMDDSIASMRIVSAADESFRTGKTIDL